jgi:NTP pyrophosphatase (non-canonical NTP hydrolase)
MLKKRRRSVMQNAVYNGTMKMMIITKRKKKMNTGETQALIEDVNNIKRWHHDRNLIDGSDDKSQFAKLIQEAGELSDNICKGKDISDDIGDMIVVLINIAERNDLSLTECVRQAWDDIKDRKGQMRDGVFIKEDDLIKESLGITK